MNKDQINSLIRTLFKVVGAALVTHGATKAAALVNSEDVIGLVITVVGLIMSHYEHAPEDKADSKNAIPPAATLFLIAGLASMSLASGCKTAPDVVAYRTEGTVITTVDAAMQAWSDWVNGGNSFTWAQVDAVKAAYDKYYAAQLVARDAFLSYETSKTDANLTAYQKALAAAGAASGDIISLVNSFLKKGN